MYHDHTTDHTCAHTPTRRCAILTLPIGVQVLDIEALCKVRAQVVAGTGLQRLAITHQRLNGISPQGARELFILALATRQHRDGSIFLSEGAVNFEHQTRTLLGLLKSTMGSVTFLPQEFGGTQEQRRTFLPAHHIIPLIDQDRQITIALDPFRIAMTNDRLAGRTNSKRLFEFLAATTRHPCDFGGETLDVLGFALQETAWDKQWEVSIDNVSLFKTPVQVLLDVFPDGIAVRTNNHAATYGRVIGQFSLAYYLVVPF